MQSIPAETLAHPERHGLPRVSLGKRLRFFWGAPWAFGVMSFCFAGYLTQRALGHFTASPAEPFKRWSTRWARAVLGLVGIRLDVTMRTELDPEEPVIFVVNHQNELDILTVLAGIPVPFGFMAKAALRKVPVLGSVLEESVCLFVDRSDPRRAVQSMKEAAARIREGNSVLVFCEGERSFSRRLLPFLRGAFVIAVEAGVPLVPVTVLDNYRLLDERRLLACGGTAHLVIGEPIPTEGKSRADVSTLMEEVRSVMQAELDRAHGVSSGLANRSTEPRVTEGR
ncbi:MAG: lysophospholipid acyltransferase family protein [Bacteroidota bacterium]